MDIKISPVLIFLIFMVLKLTKVIAWSWIWITAPLWIGLAAGLLVAGFLLCLALIVAMLDPS